MGPLEFEYMSSEFDHGTLHAETDPKERYPVLARIPDRTDLSFDPAFPETRCNQDSVKPCKFLCNILIVNIFRLKRLDIDTALIGSSGMNEGLVDRLVGVLQFDVFPYQADRHFRFRIF